MWPDDRTHDEIMKDIRRQKERELREFRSLERHYRALADKIERELSRQPGKEGGE